MDAFVVPCVAHPQFHSISSFYSNVYIYYPSLRVYHSQDGFATLLQMHLSKH